MSASGSASGRRRAVSASLPRPREHVAELIATLDALGTELDRVERWGGELAEILLGGGRLLACGNGGSAADAQHLTAELVGRFRDERQPFSAIALNAETSSLTAIANDYGYADAFARQVHAHGRPGDVLVAISTSGSSENVVRAARAARQRGLRVWALTGPGPNALCGMAHEAVEVPSEATATIQEVHGVLIHALCGEVDRVVLGDEPTGSPRPAGAVSDGGDELVGREAP